MLKVLSRLARLLAVVALAAPFLPAQQLQDYSKGRSGFPNLFGPYTPRQVPAPNFANTPRIDQLMQSGKLMLSLDDAIALALEDNLDIAIARYNLPIADTDILRAKAGASTLGVNTGLVQGTPGGGVGSIGAGGIGTSTTGSTGGGAGGTSAGTGGAGTGASGLVQSTVGAGPSIGSFDPILTAGLSIEHQTTQVSSPFSGVPVALQNTGTANFNYQQAFATGTNVNVGFNNQRIFSNNAFNALNPLLNTGFRATITQHLLQGFSINANRRFIRIAKNNREISDIAFRNQVINTVSQVENIYWDLVSAYEAVKVNERSVALSEKTLSDNQKQVQIGTLAPIEVVRAQSQVASSRQALIVAQTNLQLQQLLIKNAVTRNLTDPVLASAAVIPTSTMELPTVEPVVPIQDLVNDALSHRPELAQSRVDLVNREITKRAAANALLPSVDLVAWYGSAALGGPTNPDVICGSPNANPNFCIPPGSTAPNGWSGAFKNLFGYNFPDYAVGFNVNIPIRNRSAQATQVRSELEYRQAQMLLQQLQNQIGIEVRNAQFAVQQNRAQVDAAQKAEELAQQSLDAEQKKYALGASTNTLVLQAQRDLTQAQSNTVAALASYEKSRVELDRVTGLTLTHNGIQMADAESGNVKTLPNVPGVVPRKETTPTQQQQQMAPPPGTSPQSQAPTAQPQAPSAGTNTETTPQGTIQAQPPASSQPQQSQPPQGQSPQK
ncbi:MAG TPA: TolC family protein [Terriglobales bacterium]|nr:TolC family protein [Terriglobales bacterium]